MARFNPNWYARILRNTAEVIGDTVVVHAPPEIIETKGEPGVAETLGAAAAVIQMANEIAPPDRTQEMIALLSEVRDDIRNLRAEMQAAQTPAPVIVEVTPEPEPEPPAIEPEIIVNTGELKKEEISNDPAPTEPPKPRKSRFI